MLKCYFSLTIIGNATEAPPVSFFVFFVAVMVVIVVCRGAIFCFVLSCLVLCCVSFRFVLCRFVKMSGS